MIFVYCPKGAETGGPEALHQLVDSMKRQGLDAFITPLPGTESNGRVGQYNRYIAPEATAVDADGNIIIVPEISQDILNAFPLSNKFVWWLAAGVPANRKVGHLAQSHFAAETLINYHIEPIMLSDYTNINREIPASPNHTNIVAYNGNKGAEFIHPIRGAVPEATWIEISRMSRSQVQDVLSTAAIYLDLGHHPGKDRMPREAAISGAVTVVGKRGSAANQIDIPIDEKVDHDNQIQVVDKIRSILDNQEAYYKNQQNYRSKIANERSVFDNEVLEAFA